MEELPSVLTYTVDKTNGDLYRGTSVNQNWNSVWKSKATPQLQFGCGTINNMNWANNNVQLMTGTAGSATYAITPPAGYVITEYSFTFANNGHNTGLTLTMDNGKVYTTSSTAQTISAKAQKASSVSFTLAGGNGNGANKRCQKEIPPRCRPQLAETPHKRGVPIEQTQAHRPACRTEQKDGHCHSIHRYQAQQHRVTATQDDKTACNNTRKER